MSQGLPCRGRNLNGLHSVFVTPPNLLRTSSPFLVLLFPFTRVPMKSISVLFIVAVITTFLPQESTGQMADVAAKAAAALTTYGPVPVTITTQTPREITVCHSEDVPGSDRRRIVCPTKTVYDAKTSTSNEILKASNIRIIKADPVTFGEKTITELPEHMTVDDNIAKNCSTQPSSQTFSVSTAIQRTASLAINKSVTNTLTYGFSASGGIKDVFTVGANISIAEQKTEGTVNTTGTNMTATKTRSGTQTLQPHTFLVIELQVWPVHYTIPFSTNVIVDADLSPNDAKLQHLSDVMSEGDRTFPIAGSLEAEDSPSGELVFYDMTYDASQCPGGGAQPQAAEKVKPPKDVKLVVRPD